MSWFTRPVAETLAGLLGWVRGCVFSTCLGETLDTTSNREQRELRPACVSVWYVLATIYGEPEQTNDPRATQMRNREFWNALMGRRRPMPAGIETAFGQIIGLPEWTETHDSRMLEALHERGLGGVRVPDANGIVDFSFIHFSDDTSFEGFVFVGPTTFRGAKFGGQSHNFNNTVFFEPTTFKDAEFLGEFAGSDMKVNGILCFDEATFHLNAQFDGSRFGNVSLFNSTTFEGDAAFQRCKFADAVMIRDAEFHAMANFNEVEIQGSCVFQHAKFNDTVPGFFGATLPECPIWYGAKWPNVPTDANQALYQMQAYQRLVRMMNGLEKFDDQHMFVRQEMRVRRRTENRSVGFMNHAYELICDYGFGLGRILAIWAGHIVAGAALLFMPKLTTTLRDGAEPGWQGAKESMIDFVLALVLSFTNAHGPLGLYRTYFQEELQDWPWLIWIGPVQTVLGVIILFFLLLTIRNRFRMR